MEKMAYSAIWIVFLKTNSCQYTCEATGVFKEEKVKIIAAHKKGGSQYLSSRFTLFIVVSLKSFNQTENSHYYK